MNQIFLIYTTVPTLDTTALAHKTASPQALVQVLSNLEREHLITYRTMNTIMKFVLDCTDKDGKWKQR